MCVMKMNEYFAGEIIREVVAKRIRHKTLRRVFREANFYVLPPSTVSPIRALLLSVYTAITEDQLYYT